MVKSSESRPKRGLYGMRRRQTDLPKTMTKNNNNAHSSTDLFLSSNESKARRKWSRKATQVVGCTFLSILLPTVLGRCTFKNDFQRRSKQEMKFPEMAVFRLSEMSAVSYFSIDRSLTELKIPIEPDFGGLKISSLEMKPPHHFRRTVQISSVLQYSDEREALFKAIDDDSDDMAIGFEDIEYPTRCITPKWTADMTQVCNNVHELSYDRPPQAKDQTNNVRRLSKGHFRQTYLFTPKDGSKEFVVKNLRFVRSLSQENFKSINIEARIMESLTHSDLISDIYGHCGSTVLVEKAVELTYRLVPRISESDMNSRGYISQALLDRWELEKDDGVYPMNNYTTVEKLDTAIRMALSLAELHGHPNGAIAHDDVYINQWMYSVDGRVMLNDINNGIPLKWNQKKDQYCSSWSNYPDASFKAPEVYGEGSWVQEQVDVWPMGNLIFALLTGLEPYYDKDHETQMTIVAKGIPPYISPLYFKRSYIEQQLVEIMNQCHKHKPNDRPSIFEVIKHLKATKKAHKLGASVKPEPDTNPKQKKRRHG